VRIRGQGAAILLVTVCPASLRTPGPVILAVHRRQFGLLPLSRVYIGRALSRTLHARPRPPLLQLIVNINRNGKVRKMIHVITRIAVHLLQGGSHLAALILIVLPLGILLVFKVSLLLREPFPRLAEVDLQ